MAYKQSVMRKAKLLKLKKQTDGYGCSGAWYDPDKKRVVRYGPRSSGYRKWLQKQSNKRLRKYKDTLQNSKHKRMYDIMWEMY